MTTPDLAALEAAAQWLDEHTRVYGASRPSWQRLDARGSHAHAIAIRAAIEWIKAQQPNDLPYLLSAEIRAAIRSAVAEERKACALIAEEDAGMFDPLRRGAVINVAAKIRARGESVDAAILVAIRSAVAEEREACALIADKYNNWQSRDVSWTARCIGKLIRARWENGDV